MLGLLSGKRMRDQGLGETLRKTGKDRLGVQDARGYGPAGRRLTAGLPVHCDRCPVPPLGTAVTHGLGQGCGPSRDGVAFENWPPLATGDSATLTTLPTPGCLQGPWSHSKGYRGCLHLYPTPQICPQVPSTMGNLLLNSTTWGQKQPM